ncbi:lysylphosphatidylglycerol synthase transmembrane domain-containing protein [Desulfogranum japonicum]|uniref:lysylphosphatidylglycerol synthase transmembrane domain-containing protein n=1 Tax=Desulfogranum japonicum TaxID=231447 RepID=UPI00041B6B96|nr:lysylphosphatidylglycerol synthase transmembrane domain-containing protein [Desulfogranum japonicum]
MQYLLGVFKSLWQKPLARALTSILILGVLFTQLPIAEFGQTFSKISFTLWGLVVTVFILGHLVGAAKWNVLINIGQGGFSYLPTVRYYFAGLFANLFLPSIAGGDVVRAGLAIRQNSMEKEAVVLGSLLDRFLDMVALALLIMFGALFSPLGLGVEDRWRILWVCILLASLFIGVLLFVVVPIPSSTPAKVLAIIERVRSILRQLFLRPQKAILGLFLALLIQGTFVVINAFLAKHIGLDLPLAVWFLAWPLAKLTATLPISLGGLGVREAALSIFLGKFGVSMVAAVSLGLMWQAVLICGGGLGGIYYIIASHQLPTAQELGVATKEKHEDA